MLQAYRMAKRLCYPERQHRTLSFALSGERPVRERGQDETVWMGHECNVDKGQTITAFDYTLIKVVHKIQSMGWLPKGL